MRYPQKEYASVTLAYSEARERAIAGYIEQEQLPPQAHPPPPPSGVSKPSELRLTAANTDSTRREGVSHSVQGAMSCIARMGCNRSKRDLQLGQ